MSKYYVDATTAIDLTMDICGILMENGTDISRIEASAEELCKAFGVRQIGLLVIPTFITITFIDENQKKQEASRRYREGGTNLSKIEDACNLITGIKEGSIAIDKICKRISDMKSANVNFWYKRLAAYIGVATMFTLIFMGANVLDLSILQIIMHILSTIICSISIYLIDKLLAKAEISDIFTKALSSMLLVIVLFGCQSLIELWWEWKLFSMYILMGSIMLIVPGIKFTNGVRDLFAGDVASATIHVVGAVFATVGIVLGIVLMQSVLSYDLLIFPTYVELNDAPNWYLALSVFITGIGTIFFAWYFYIDTQHIWLSFLAGATTWFVFLLGKMRLSAHNEIASFASMFGPYFLAALCATLISENVAHKKNIPSMIFLFPAIVSLIPGGSLYKALDSVINNRSLNNVSMISETLYAAGGISCGVLAVAAVNRIWMAFIDAVDTKTSKITERNVHIIRSKELYDEATRLYTIAKRYYNQDISYAFDFYRAANESYERAINEIAEIDGISESYQKDDAQFRFDVFLYAGINLFWMYRCAICAKLSDNLRREYLSKAMEKYDAAEKSIVNPNVISSHKRCVLSNWMGVMKINMARFEIDDIEWDKCINEADLLLRSAIDQDTSYSKAYLNLAEVSFARLARMLGIKYGETMDSSTLPSNIDNNTIELLFTEIEDQLRRAIARDPHMINSYYKMAQLQTYKIYYATKCLREKIENTIEYQKEAEKWLLIASMFGQQSLGYLYICREYYELIDKKRAKDINRVIETIASNR